MPLTLKDALEKDDDTNVMLQIKVIEVVKEEKTNAGKSYLLVRIGDESGTSTLRVYKEDQFQKFHELPSLLLINVLKKPSNFIFTSKSMASYCKTISAASTELHQPQVRKNGTIKDLYEMKATSPLTLKCRVVHVSPVKDRTNSYTGMPLKLRHLIIKDDTRSSKIALWNDLGTTSYTPGDVVEISDIKVTTFEGKKLLGSTPSSSMQFLAAESDIPNITEDDRRLAYEDPDFQDSVKIQGSIRGFDSIKVYQTCPQRACMNKEIVSGICSNCKKEPDSNKKYMKVLLTIQNTEDETQISNLTMFYPDYCTLCAYLNLKTDLDASLIRSNLLGMLDKVISYNLRKTCISNISLKRKSSD